IDELVVVAADREPRFCFQRNVAGNLVVDADPMLTEEVVTYLLENAVRNSPENGQIEIEAQREDRRAGVSGTDHGPGIPLEGQPHVLGPFYEQVPLGPPGYIPLISLGLYVSKLILDCEGGRIWLTSQPGAGSTFSFSLSLSDI